MDRLFLRTVVLPVVALALSMLALSSYAQADGDAEFRLLMSKARAGDMAAMHQVADRYERAYGVDLNYAGAAQWFRAAADAGYEYSWERLGRLYESGHGVAQDYEEAARLYNKGLERGQRTAAWRLGLLTLAGRGVPQDRQRAMELVAEAGKRGLNQAWVTYGDMFVSDPDLRKRVDSWEIGCETAAEAGDPTAMHCLAFIRESAADYPSAVTLYERLERSGDGFASMKLANLYFLGRGVQKSMESAFLHSWRAEKNGHPEGRAAMDNLLKELTTTTIASNSANVRRAANTQSPVAGTLERGARVYLLAEEDDWYAVYSPDLDTIGAIAGQLLTSHVERQAAAVAASRQAAAVAAANSSPWPARPPHSPGVTRCNTRCTNGDCHRTYSDGRQIRFQAKRVWSSFENRFDWDSGTC